jgi:hypothetical protein
MSKLTAKSVQNSKPGRVGDGDGLWLATSPTLKRRWLVRFSQSGKVTEKALGLYPYMSLADARDAAYQFKRNLQNGITPIRKITFGQVAAEVLASKTHLRPHTAYQMKISTTQAMFPLPDIRDIRPWGSPELPKPWNAPKIEPLDFLLAVMRSSEQPTDRRLEAAKAAAPYRHRLRRETKTPELKQKA